MIPGFANLNYYEILDVSMGVDAKEVQEAYYLVREAFSKNSLASYSLYPQEEREEIGKLIEEAYHILFDEQARHEYDRNLSENRIRVEKSKKTLQAALPFDESAEALKAAEALASAADLADSAPAEPETADPVDSTAPTLPFTDEETPAPVAPAPEASARFGAPGNDDDDGDEEEDENDEPLLLIDPAPTEPEPSAERPAPAGADETTPADPPTEAPVTDPTPAPARADTSMPRAVDPTPPPASDTTNPVMVAVNPGRDQRDPESTGPRRAMLDHLRDGITGASLKRVREQLGLTLDQAFEVTRIRRPILQSIEEEEFDQLPAAVFLRGMVSNYARFLSLPDPDAAAKSYVERMTAALGG